MKKSQPFGAEWIEIILYPFIFFSKLLSQPFGAEWIEIFNSALITVLTKSQPFGAEWIEMILGLR